MTRERVAALYQDRAAREAQYAQSTDEAAEAARTNEERLQRNEATLQAVTRDYLHTRRELERLRRGESETQSNALRYWNSLYFELSCTPLLLFPQDIYIA